MTSLKRKVLQWRLPAAAGVLIGGQTAYHVKTNAVVERSLQRKGLVHCHAQQRLASYSTEGLHLA